MLNKGVTISKKTKLVTFLCILVISIPVIVYSQSSKIKISNESQKQKVDNLNNQMNEVTKNVGNFPTGTYQVPTKTIKTPQRASTQVTKLITNQSDQWYKIFIYNHESGNNPARWNSSGCVGLGQACPASKLLAVCPSLDYACEDAWFTRYAISRYGSWKNAYMFWVSHRWW